MNGQSAIVELLICDFGQNWTYYDVFQNNALIYAAKNDFVDVVRFLVSVREWDLNFVNKHGVLLILTAIGTDGGLCKWKWCLCNVSCMSRRD
jgi:hypothetical protein